MEIKEMKHEDIQQRMSAIQEELQKDDCDVEALKAEVAELQERDSQLKEEAEERKNIIDDVIANAKTIEERKEEKKMEEVRNTKQYADAYAQYLKGMATSEERALLTTNTETGTVEVPEFVDSYIWTNWDKSGILSGVRKTFVKGNYKVNYEASATGAVKHLEGTDAPAEEQLTLGAIEFKAEYIKKWITVSDNVIALRGQEFVDYLHDEFDYQLAKAIEKEIIDDITASALSAKVTHAIDADAVLAGLTALSDEATNPVAIMSKATYATLKGLRSTTGDRLADVFEGLQVIFNNNVEGVMVGDLSNIIVNFPDGEDFKFVIDDKSLAEKDMIKIVGKIMASAHLVRPNGFAVVKPE